MARSGRYTQMVERQSLARSWELTQEPELEWSVAGG